MAGRRGEVRIPRDRHIRQRPRQDAAQFKRVRAQFSKLCQKLRRRQPALANATDAETQHFQRWPTPTDARTSLPKQTADRAALAHHPLPDDPCLST